MKKNRIETKGLREFFTNDANGRKAWGWALAVWSPLNQRTIFGAYANSPSQRNNPQVQSYLSKGYELRVSKEDFFKWVGGQQDTVIKMYQEGEVPSLDRIDSNGHYELSNMRIITKRDNWRRGNTGESKSSRAGDVAVKLKNRLAYVNAQEGKTDYSEKKIDSYLKKYPIKWIMTILTNEEILDLFDLVENDYVVNVAYVKSIESAIAKAKEEEELKLKEQTEKANIRREAQLALIARREEEAFLRDLKKHPMYDEVYSIIFNRHRVMKRQLKEGKTLDEVKAHKPTPFDDALLNGISPYNVTREALKAIVRH